MFAPYAKLEVIGIVTVGGAATALTGMFLGWWAVLPGLLAIGLLSFYRDPPRTPPARADVLVAPADGKVVDVSHVPASADGPAHISITIFLSVANVHVNRSPCAGKVIEVIYTPGKFLNALGPDANLHNEANLVGFEPSPPLVGPIFIRQIAGLLAKRIVCAVKPADAVILGQRIGMIKLGSRTELRLPDDGGWEVHSRVGDTVKGALTIMVSRRETRGSAG